ncbi:NAD(P)(+) transhydrogenase (Re/Si-specific) subunit beta [Ferviditalea candida]|uniref:NAD(P) transhydrogenase subunit beta n=1 Tax=Ferviditalea candida TaxID=3108399 RepID=A0ABU5ZJT8_9BACL|nr:NAD(P)(+) transhydrogenase (Re/Si-specific) subunit beta [Paenibacillaceae bacterium T2]
MNNLTQIAYLLTSIFFILGVMRLRSPATARSGNLLAGIGMAIAVIAVLITDHHFSFILIGLAVAAGVIVGTVSAKRVRMTAMPQMVALFNGMGGGAAALVSIGEWIRSSSAGESWTATLSISALFTILIGSISFTGSVVAFAKLQEWITGRPITYPGQKAVNALLFAAALVIAVILMFADPSAMWAAFLIFVILSLALGVLVTLPIGGADMPVVISLLNAFTGLAAAATGFLLANNVLIIAGALVGASGTILTQQMSRAMNRPIANILFGAFGKVSAGASSTGDSDGVVQPATVEDVAMLLAYARRVVIVPGYGLAVARAQQEVRQLADKLAPRGVNVIYGIHPVAGRMPGHMNVLLAEANVPYDKLYEMEAVNPEFPETDVVLVIGANDVTNPAARNEPSSPLYGMPVLNVDQARRIIVLKRSMSPGFAGIDNPLYTNPKTNMLFGDAKETVGQLLRALDDV